MEIGEWKDRELGQEECRWGKWAGGEEEKKRRAPEAKGSEPLQRRWEADWVQARRVEIELDGVIRRVERLRLAVEDHSSLRSPSRCPCPPHEVFPEIQTASSCLAPRQTDDEHRPSSVSAP